MQRKIMILFIVGLFFIFNSIHCAKKPEVRDSPRVEEVRMTLTSPPEVKSENFTLQLSNLTIVKWIDTETKEMTAAPSFRGSVKISNHSNKILDIQGVSIQYLDKAGNPISFATGEQRVTVAAYWTELDPGRDAERFITVDIPREAVKEKMIEGVEVKVIYVPTPLKREALKLPLKIE